jgi:hypothetical protein
MMRLRMPINSDKTPLWKADIAQSIDFYNDWFFRFGPGTPQFDMLKRWLIRHGYKQIVYDVPDDLDAMPVGTFTFRPAISIRKRKTSVNIPIDCVVKPFAAGKTNLPVLIIETKLSENTASSIRSAKRDARKFATFKEHLEKNVKFMLLLCGYFDGYYLGPQAAEGIDWVWQHRLNDLSVMLVRDKVKDTESWKESSMYTRGRNSKMA